MNKITFKSENELETDNNFNQSIIDSIEISSQLNQNKCNKNDKEKLETNETKINKYKVSFFVTEEEKRGIENNDGVKEMAKNNISESEEVDIKKTILESGRPT